MSGRPTATEPGAVADGGFWSRRGWAFLLGLVVVVGLFGVGDLVRGLDADPAIPVGVTGLDPDEIRGTSAPLAALLDLQSRAGGVHLLLLATVWGAILLVPFRRGELWAWAAMWTFPVWGLAAAGLFLLVDLEPGAAPPPPAVSGWVFAAATAALLLATRPIRRPVGHG